MNIEVRRKDGSLAGIALVDECDAHLAELNWSLMVNGYARHRRALLHRVVLGLTPGDGLQADHINRNKLDCRRENLRVVTHAQNGQNLPGVAAAASRYRGVGFHALTQKWRARVMLDGVDHYLGLFDTEEEAAAVASAWRAEHMPFAVEARAC